MKKLLIYLLLILMFGSIFGIAIQSVSNNIEEEAPVVSSLLGYIAPAIAYADSDTVSGPSEGPPPPPID